MKKGNLSFFKHIFVLIVSLAIAFVIFAGVYGFTIMHSPDIITIGVGETYTLSPNQRDYSIRSYHADVVSPLSGSSISGVSTGEGIVCIRYSYFNRDFYKFRVVEAPLEITLDKTELKLGIGEAYTMNASCKSGSHEYKLTYKSSDQSVATVSENGIINAVSTGECVITASAYNNLESSCTLTVTDAPTSISFDKNEVVLGETEQLPLKLTFNENEHSSSVTYSSSDENVAKVENGVITALSTGSCTITATTHNGVKSECEITVKKLPESINLVVEKKHIVDTVFRVLYDIPNDTAASDIDLKISDDNVLSIDETDPMLIHCKKKGNATITLTLSNGVTASKEITVDNYTKNNINFTTLNQYPYLPTGCEVVSLTSVLRHYGCDIDAMTMAEKYMPKVSYDYFSVSPHDYFLGDPKSQDGFGCFSGCIVKTAENYFEDNNIDDLVAVDISGCTTDELYSYLLNDIPVITWVTSGFVTPYNSGSWVVNGETVNWCNHEHCLVTIGFDKNTGRVAVADNSGGYNYTVDKHQYEVVFRGMGRMAVAVLKK